MGEAHDLNHRGVWINGQLEWSEYNPEDGPIADILFKQELGLRLDRGERDALMRCAHEAVRYAIESGRLVRPKTCSSCGREGRIEAHHASYRARDWLHVEWLCQPCHAERPGGKY